MTITAQMPDDDVTADGWFKDQVECELDDMLNDPARCAQFVRDLEEASQLDAAFALGYLIANCYAKPALARDFIQDLRNRLEDANRSKAERRVLRQLNQLRYA